MLVKWLVLLAIAGLALFCLLLSLVRREAHVGQDGEIQWDDFGFSVLEHRTEKKVGDVAAKGVFHVVHLEVRNHAKRVSYRLDQHRVMLRDEDRSYYPVNKEAQRLLDPTWPQRNAIPPGTTFASELVFDVPEDKTNVRLWISWGGPLVDVIDDIVFGQRDIALQ